MRHKLFVGRTVLVQNGQVDKAFRLLNRILGEATTFRIKIVVQLWFSITKLLEILHTTYRQVSGHV